MLQASPFLHWLENDEDFRSLAKLFSVHHFGEGDTLPESSFYMVASGLISMHTDSGKHEPVTHGRGSFVISVNANVDVSKKPVSHSRKRKAHAQRAARKPLLRSGALQTTVLRTRSHLLIPSVPCMHVLLFSVGMDLRIRRPGGRFRR